MQKKALKTEFSTNTSRTVIKGNSNPFPEEAVFESIQKSGLEGQTAAILEALPDGVTAQDPAGTIIYANAAAASLLSIDSAEMLVGTKGETVRKNFYIFDQDGKPFADKKKPSNIALSGKIAPKATMRLRKKNSQEEFWLRVRSTPIFDSRGKVSMVVNIFRDITESILTEEKLRHNEAINRFLAQAGEVLSSSLNYPETLTTVARFSVPELADWCAVDIIDEQGRIHRITVAHKNPKKIKVAHQIERDFPGDPESKDGIYGVIKSGQPQFIPQISDHLVVRIAQNPQHLRLLRSIGFTGIMIVPLKTKDKILGAITLVSAESKKVYTKDDLSFAEELARRASLAIENARLYEAEKRAHIELEQKVLERTEELEKANAVLRREIAEHAKAENALRQNQQLLRQVLDTLPVAVWVTDDKGRIIMENPAGQEMWGEKTFIGQTDTSKYKMWWADSGKEIQHDETAMVRALKKGETTICEVINIQSADGAKKTVLNSAFPLWDSNDNIDAVIVVNEDISDRQKTAEELAASRKELRDFIDSFTIFSAKLSTDGTFLLANRAFSNILGISQQELSSRNFLNGRWWKYDPEAQERIGRALEKAVSEKTPQELDEHMLTPDNHVLTISLHLIPISQEGEVQYVLLEGADVTKQRQAEKELKDSQERLTEAQKIAHIGSWQWDVFYNVVLWSDELFNIYGVSKTSQGTYEGFLQLVHPEDKDRVEKIINETLYKKAAFDFKHRIIRPNGDIRMLHARGDVVTNPKGDVIEIFGTAQDITEQEEARRQLELYTKRLEASREQIQKEKAKDEAVLSSMGEGIIATDIKGNIVMINPQGESLLGIKKEAVLGKPLFETMPLLTAKGDYVPLEQRPAHLALTRGKKIFIDGIQNSYFYQRKDKSTFPVSITVSPIIINKKITGCVEVFRDITKEKELDRSKTEFISLTSHQLRTPLAALNWYAESLLSLEVGPLNKTQKLYLEQMRHGNKRLVTLINDLLNVSRIDLGTFVVQPEKIDIKKLIHSVTEELKPLTANKKLKVKETYSRNIPAIVCDKNLVRIILQNLITNSVKYTAKGSISISVKPQPKSRLLISVKDTGLGIPKHQQGKVFEKLFRGDNVLKKDIDGTGLGLYMVKSITEFLGGKIWFESKESRGSNFFIELPIKSHIKKQEGKTLT